MTHVLRLVVENLRRCFAKRPQSIGRPRVAAVGVALLVLGSFQASAQIQGNSPAINAVDAPSTNYSIAAVSGNSRVWQKTVVIGTNRAGRSVFHTNSYTELVTGMNHLVNGQWVESSENIEITATGGVATNGQHQVGFAANLNASNAVEIITPGGKALGTHILGISYFDASASSNVLIAETQDSIGQLVASNQVVYPNAFSNLTADARYTYRLGSFEQDIVLRQQLPPPSGFGLTAQSTWIQVWTEFVNSSTPAIEEVPNAGDINLDFGTMQIRDGRAFAINDTSNSIAVRKQWLKIQGRTFLVESVPFLDATAALTALPAQGSGTGGTNITPIRYQGFPQNLPPAPTLARKSGESLQLANRAGSPDRGFVMDYVTLNTTTTNFTFYGDQTYYINGACNLNGTTTIEGGTVIKFQKSSAVGINYFGPINCAAAPYRMAIMTTANDDTAGQTISGSTGVPQFGAFFIVDRNTSSALSLTNVRISYANQGVETAAGAIGVEFWDCQFVDCSVALNVPSGYANLHNVLITSTNKAFQGFNIVNAENVTIDTPIAWTGSGGTFNLTNSIINGSVGTPTTFTTNCVVFSPGSSAFQSVGAGNYYLAAGSPYRDAGTTNLSASLLEELSNKTTFPPLYLTNTVSSDTTFFPQAARDIDTPDLGYHYDPIDYLCSFVLTNATLTLTNGVALGYYTTYGVWAENNSTIISQGSPIQPNRFAYYNLVQEQSTNLSGLSYGLSDSLSINPYHDNANQNPSIYLRFTTISAPQGASYFLDTGGTYEPASLTLRDCEVFGAGSQWYESGATNAVYTFQNSLLHYANVNAFPNGGSITWYNNLFHGTTNESVTAFNFGSANLTNHDNAFDGLASVTLDGTNGWNAYLNLNTNNVTSGLFTNDVVATNFTWQTSWLGTFYQATNSPLTNNGSRTADLAGLYHYTTQTNQVKETNSVVDIGYHYVAVDGNGNPIDSNGDGIPDYLQDANGNGTVDGLETDWSNSTSGNSGSTSITVFTPLQ